MLRDCGANMVGEGRRTEAACDVVPIEMNATPPCSVAALWFRLSAVALARVAIVVSRGSGYL